MKLDTNLFAAKPPSLEEGAMSHQHPEGMVANRVGTRSHYQRCVQVLKVILYLELIVFIGWLGCVSMAKYYQEPQYNDLGMPFVNPDRNNDTSDDQPQKESITHAEPLLQEKNLHQKSPLQEPSIPSAEAVSSEMNSPLEAYVIWMTEDDPLPKNTELNSNDEATTEQVVDKDLTEVENSSTNSNSDELDAPGLNMFLSKLFEDMSGPKTDSDNLGDRQDLEEPFKDSHTGILIPEIKTDDTSELDEPFKSFEERWNKILASIDEDLNAAGSISDSSDESEGTLNMRIPYFGMMDRVSKEDSDMVPDSTFELPLLHELLLNPNYLDALPDSDQLDSSSDSMDAPNLHFGFEDPLLNERNFWRLVRDTRAEIDSDSKSSSEETTTLATKTKRSADSSSGESDENSNSSSNEDIVEQMMMKILSPKCPKILDDDGRPIENPKRVIADIKKTWHKFLLATPVPDCGDVNTPKIITIDECGQFVIECKLPEIKNETIPN